MCNHIHSSGQPVSLSRKDLILAEFNLASFSQDRQITKLKTPPNFPTNQYLSYSLPLVAFAIDWFQHLFFEFQSSVVESGYSPLPAFNRSVEHMNSLLTTWQHEYQTVEALSWYYCNNCTGVLSTHAWGYPCTYSQCLQLSLQTADFSSPVSKITLLSLELDRFSSHFCLQPSLVLLTMSRSNMHVSSHLETTPSIGSLPSVFASLSTACWSQHLSPELLLFAVESVLFAVESVLFAVESEHPFAGVGYSSAGVGHFSAPAFPCSPICYRRWESHSACSPVNI